MASTDARPVPIKNTAYRVYLPILDADGDLVTGATGLDSEISKDGGTFADCTNEATEIATSSGMYYLDLTSTEMNADAVCIIVKTSSSGAKTTPIVLYPQESGDIKVDVQSYGGTAGTFSGGRPEVNASHIAGSAVSTSTAQIGVNVVNFGGSAGTFASGVPAVNATQISGDSTAADNLENAFDDTAGPVPWMGIIDQGTAQSFSSTGGVLRAAAAFGDNTLIGMTIAAYGSDQGYWQVRTIIDNALSGDTFTVDAFDVTPSGATLLYKIFASAPSSTSAPPAVNVTQWAGSAVATPSVAGVPEVDLTHVAGSTTNVSALATNVDAILTDTAVIGAAGAGLSAIPWNASWDAEVQSEVNDGLVAYGAATATDVSTAAANVSVDEIQATALADLFNTDSGTTYASAVSGSVVAEIADNAAGGGLDAAGVRAAVGLASANLDTQLSTIDSVADGIKTKTDSLTFTVANKVDANVKSVNDVTVTGTGALGDEWGP